MKRTLIIFSFFLHTEETLWKITGLLRVSFLELITEIKINKLIIAFGGLRRK